MHDHKTTNAKLRLLKLASTGICVFHGSPDGEIHSLEPRQGFHLTNRFDKNCKAPDGKPAVSATIYPEIAIIRAIINHQNITMNYSSGFGATDEGKTNFRVSSKEVLEHAKGKTGYVYVLDKSKFHPYNRDGDPDEREMEWRTIESVEPIEIIQITAEDLPPTNRIEITHPEKEV